MYSNLELFIDGQWLNGGGRRGEDVINPATEKPLASLPHASQADLEQALEAAQIADVIMYPVLVMPITNDAGRNIGGENALTTLSAGTGGRVFTPAAAAELDRAFVDILRELRTQYLIGYYPKDVPPSRDRFHTLKVNVRGRNLRVLTRSGYYGESNESTNGLGR